MQGRHQEAQQAPDAVFHAAARRGESRGCSAMSGSASRLASKWQRIWALAISGPAPGGLANRLGWVVRLRERCDQDQPLGRDHGLGLWRPPPANRFLTHLLQAFAHRLGRLAQCDQTNGDAGAAGGRHPGGTIDDIDATPGLHEQAGEGEQAALEAAAAGQGVMLGLTPVIFDAPSAKDLVMPCKAKSLNAGAYYVVYRRRDRARPVVRAFVDWITREMQSDIRRLRQLSKDAGRSVHATPD